MKQFVTILVLLLSISVIACSQNFVASPQDVTFDWDPDTPTTGTVQAEFSVIEVGADKLIEGNYRSVIISPDIIQTVDLEALGLYGEYIVSIRYVREYNGGLDSGPWAYADLVKDTGPEGPFILYRLEPLGAILGIRIFKE